MFEDGVHEALSAECVARIRISISGAHIVIPKQPDSGRLGYLYLHDGMWDRQRIVSSEWVKESVTPYFQTDEPQFKYGFMWWLSKLPDSTEYVWMCRGFGGQNLQVFPKKGLIVTFTAWDILPNSTGKEPVPSEFLPALKAKTCSGAVH